MYSHELWDNEVIYIASTSSLSHHLCKWLAAQDPCNDLTDQCERWKAKGQCSHSAVMVDFMKENCRLTCGYCKITGMKRIAFYVKCTANQSQESINNFPKGFLLCKVSLENMLIAKSFAKKMTKCGEQVYADQRHSFHNNCLKKLNLIRYISHNITILLTFECSFISRW